MSAPEANESARGLTRFADTGKQSGQLDVGGDDVRLNLGGNRAAAVSVRKRGGGVIGCGFQLSSLPGLDFAAENCSLAKGDGWNARRGGAAFRGLGLNRYPRETGGLHVAADQCRVV